ncbi:MAG: hypothetical protein ACRDIB_03060 [Ardenticatenaceae bacterium]
MEKSWPIAIGIATWVLSAVVALVFEPAWGAPIDALRSVAALLITAAIFVLLALRPAWITVLLCAAGAALLATHVYQLIARTLALLAVDPEFGAFQAAWLKLSMLVTAPLKLGQDGFVYRAMVELFWNVATPVLQAYVVWATSRALARKAQSRAAG